MWWITVVVVAVAAVVRFGILCRRAGAQVQCLLEELEGRA
jgi:hypothetical protein